MAITNAQQAKQLLALGGRIGLQEGGGIEQRLEQLGGDVTSAEQVLQAINKRLETAESSLGSGGGGIGSFTPKIPPGALTVTNLGQPPRPDNPLLSRPGVAAQPLPFMGRPILRPINATLPATLEAVQPLAGPQPAPIPAGAMVGGTITADNTLNEIMASIDESRKVGITPLFGNNAGDGLFSLDDPNAPRFDNLSDAFKFAQRNAEVLRGGKDRLPGDRTFAGERGFDDFSKNYSLQDGALTRNPIQSQGVLGIPAAGYADGGNVVGGEFDFESARQMYGLGKLVKKATRAVKKVAKSDLGKAAITAAGIYYLGGGGNPFTAAGRSGFSFANLPGASLFGPKGAGKFLFSPVQGSGSIFAGIPGGAVTAGIVGASALAGLLTPKQEEEAQTLATEEGIDIEAARRSILNAGTSKDFRARGFRAEGGPAEGKEPVAKKTMPLLDMGGQEMDLRAEGGFVPIGRMEKADDVPARLSKNEFVFTADAVRNAGDGNVDKGAEVMYNMMKNLEAGGDVSEESQGLEGARRMFQTSQRLEEVL